MIGLSKKDPLYNKVIHVFKRFETLCFTESHIESLCTVRQMPQPLWLFKVLLMSARGILSGISPQSQDSLIARFCQSALMIRSPTGVVLCLIELSFHDARLTFGKPLVLGTVFLAMIFRSRQFNKIGYGLRKHLLTALLGIYSWFCFVCCLHIWLSQGFFGFTN